jgi:hypothetical protein
MVEKKQKPPVGIGVSEAVNLLCRINPSFIVNASLSDLVIKAVFDVTSEIGIPASNQSH